MVLCSVVVRIPAYHKGDQGSIPRCSKIFLQFKAISHKTVGGFGSL